MGNRRSSQFKERVIEFNRLENRLQSTLRPMQPRPEFVGELRRQLSTRGMVLTKPAIPPAHFFIVLSVSMISMLLIVAMSVRTVAMLITMFGLWQQLRRQG